MRLSKMVAVLALAMSAAFAGSGAANAAAGQPPSTQATDVSVLNCENRWERFAIGGDSAVWHMWQTSPGGSWTSWVSMGGKVLPNGIDADVNGDCKIELFAIGTNHAVYTRWQTQASHGPWANWTSLGGYLAGGIYTNFNAQGHLGVCGTGGDGNTWCNRHTKPHASPWTGWRRG